MCLITILVWIVIIISVVLLQKIELPPNASAIIGISALVAGIVLPIIINFWRPLFFRWATKRGKLRAKLLADGVVSSEDVSVGAKYVMMSEVMPGTDKKIAKSDQYAFFMTDGKQVRIAGEKYCVTSGKYSIVPSCTGKCSKCWVIWACGGDNFRMRADVDGKQREFFLMCLEGRNLRGIARSTEMLEELVGIDARDAKSNPQENRKDEEDKQEV